MKFVVVGLVLIIISVIGVIIGLFALKSYFGGMLRPGAAGGIKVEISDSQIQFSGIFCS